MTTDQANIVYDLMIVACGATEYWRENFVLCVTEEDCREYRCCGAFGSGGKFRRNRQRWWVDCYKEDETVARLATIAAVNRVLKALKELADIPDENA